MYKGIPKEELEIYFQYGVDLKNRRIFLKDEIDEHSIGIVIQALYAMDVAGDDPIELFIGSYGGTEYDTLALHDVCRSITSDIHTVAYGKCMSAAPLLVASGEEGNRYAMPNTFFMIHQSSWESENLRAEEHARNLKHYSAVGEVWYDLMAKYTSKDKAFWKRLVSKVGDNFFDAATAVEYGIVDQLWSEKP